MNKLPKLGTGKRFANLKEKLETQGVDDPAALAAAIGRKKLGQKKMTKISTAGRMRKK